MSNKLKYLFLLLAMLLAFSSIPVFSQIVDNDEDGVHDGFEWALAEYFKPILHKHALDNVADLADVDDTFISNCEMSTFTQSLILDDIQMGNLYFMDEYNPTSTYDYNHNYSWTVANELPLVTSTVGVVDDDRIAYSHNYLNFSDHYLGSPEGQRPLYFHVRTADDNNNNTYYYIQYWYFLRNNDLSGETVNDTYHQGDWEHVEIKITYSGNPELDILTTEDINIIVVNFYQHYGLQTRQPGSCWWSPTPDCSIPHNIQQGFHHEDAHHLNVYIAKNGHTSYNRNEDVHSNDPYGHGRFEETKDKPDYGLWNPFFWKYDFLEKMGEVDTLENVSIDDIDYEWIVLPKGSDSKPFLCFKGYFGSSDYFSVRYPVIGTIRTPPPRSPAAHICWNGFITGTPYWGDFGPSYSHDMSTPDPNWWWDYNLANEIDCSVYLETHEYTLGGDLEIKSGGILEFEAGSVITDVSHLIAEDIPGIRGEDGIASISVSNGTFVAKGTLFDPVTFEAPYMLSMSNSEGNMTLQHVAFESDPYVRWWMGDIEENITWDAYNMNHLVGDINVKDGGVLTIPHYANIVYEHENIHINVQEGGLVRLMGTPESQFIFEGDYSEDNPVRNYYMENVTLTGNVTLDNTTIAGTVNFHGTVFVVGDGLTIEPGTTVNLHYGPITVNNGGEIIADGTNGEIVFNYLGEDNRYCVVVQGDVNDPNDEANASAESIFRYCRFESEQKGLHFQQNQTHAVQYCTFNCDYRGIFIERSSVPVNNCTFNNIVGESARYTYGGEAISIMKAGSNGSDFMIRNNTFTDCRIGVKVGYVGNPTSGNINVAWNHFDGCFRKAVLLRNTNSSCRIYENYIHDYNDDGRHSLDGIYVDGGNPYIYGNYVLADRRPLWIVNSTPNLAKPGGYTGMNRFYPTENCFENIALYIEGDDVPVTLWGRNMFGFNEDHTMLIQYDNQPDPNTQIHFYGVDWGVDIADQNVNLNIYCTDMEHEGDQDYYEKGIINNNIETPTPWDYEELYVSHDNCISCHVDPALDPTSDLATYQTAYNNGIVQHGTTQNNWTFETTWSQGYFEAQEYISNGNYSSARTEFSNVLSSATDIEYQRAAMAGLVECNLNDPSINVSPELLSYESSSHPIVVQQKALNERARLNLLEGNYSTALSIYESIINNQNVSANAKLVAEGHAMDVYISAAYNYRYVNQLDDPDLSQSLAAMPGLNGSITTIIPVSEPDYQARMDDLERQRIPGTPVDQTNITTNTTWDASTVLLKDDITVASGATLTIEAGTIVKGDNVSIFVDGKIEVNGSSEAPIRFTPLIEGSNTGGVSIVLQDGSSTNSFFRYCSFHNSDEAIMISNQLATPLRGLEFHNCTFGIQFKPSIPSPIGIQYCNFYSDGSFTDTGIILYDAGTNSEIAECRFFGSMSGIRADASNVLIENNYFENYDQTLDEVYAIELRHTGGFINHNTIVDHNSGILLFDSSPSINENQITGCGQEALWCVGKSYPDMSGGGKNSYAYNWFEDNGIRNDHPAEIRVEDNIWPILGGGQNNIIPDLTNSIYAIYCSVDPKSPDVSENYWGDGADDPTILFDPYDLCIQFTPSLRDPSPTPRGYQTASLEEDLFADGLAAMSVENYDLAIELFEEVIETDPNISKQVYAISFLDYCWEHNGNSLTALNSYLVTIRENATRREVINCIGNTIAQNWILMEYYDEAIEYYQTILQDTTFTESERITAAVNEGYAYLVSIGEYQFESITQEGTSPIDRKSGANTISTDELLSSVSRAETIESYNLYFKAAMTRLRGLSRSDRNADSLLPTEFSLKQNYPNPFNPSTTIVFDVPVSSNVEISIYNMLGQKVLSLVDQEMQVGQHHVVANMPEFSSGMYFVVMKSNDFRQIRKMLLMK